MTWYLGWDCAYRTLAYTLMKYDEPLLNSVRVELKALATAISTTTTQQQADDIERRLLEVKRRAKQVIVIERMEVVDLLGDVIKNFTPVELARALKIFLDKSPVSAASIARYNPIVIIEHQPPKIAKYGGATTEPASTVSHQLMFYYSEYQAVRIDSKNKNTMALTPKLHFDNYIAGCKTDPEKKAARKKHTTDNFTYILANFQSPPINIIHSKLNHAADACLQILAYIKMHSPQYTQ